MAFGPGTAVHSIMLGTSVCLVILGISRPLHALDYRHAHTGGQVGVLPQVSCPRPQRGRGNVHVGIPKRQSFVHLPVAAFFVRIVIFRTSLIAYRRVHGLHGLIVEHGSIPMVMG